MLNRGRAVILGGRAEMVTSPRIQAGLARPLRGEEGGADGWARLAARERATRAWALVVRGERVLALTSWARWQGARAGARAERGVARSGPSAG